MSKLLALSFLSAAFMSSAFADGQPVRTFHCQGMTGDEQVVVFDVAVKPGRSYIRKPRIAVDRDYNATATLTFVTPLYGRPVTLNGTYGEYFRIVNYRSEDEGDTNIMEYRLLLDGPDGSGIRQLNVITEWDYTKGDYYSEYSGSFLMLEQVDGMIRDVQCAPDDKFRGGRPTN